MIELVGFVRSTVVHRNNDWVTFTRLQGIKRFMTCNKLWEERHECYKTYEEKQIFIKAIFLSLANL